MLKVIWKSLRDGVATTRYPDEPSAVPPRFRGAPELHAGAELAALPEPSVCPSGAISRDRASSRYAVDLGRCIFCGRCAADPPVGPPAIAIGHRFELAARSRQDLVVEVAGGADGRITAVHRDPPEQLAERLSREIRRAFGRSLHLRHLDAGSCNACDWELTALLNPIYDVRRLGIDFVASPRHADGVIVTGPVTRNLELAVRRTYEAMAAPRIVIAVGACATSGGIVGQSYASCGGVAEVLPVDVFIPGCPPRPEAIIFGILMAVGRIETRRG